MGEGRRRKKEENRRREKEWEKGRGGKEGGRQRNSMSNRRTQNNPPLQYFVHASSSGSTDMHTRIANNTGSRWDWADSNLMMKLPFFSKSTLLESNIFRSSTSDIRKYLLRCG